MLRLTRLFYAPLAGRFYRNLGACTDLDALVRCGGGHLQECALHLGREGGQGRRRGSDAREGACEDASYRFTVVGHLACSSQKPGALRRGGLGKARGTPVSPTSSLVETVE